MIKDVFKILELDRYEVGLIINALNNMRNKLIKENNETEDLDKIILKILNAKARKNSFKKILCK